MKVFKSIYNGGCYGGGAFIVAANSVEDIEKFILEHTEYFEYFGYDPDTGKNVIDYSEMSHFEEVENLFYNSIDDKVHVIAHEVYRE